jgi:hypothetical protein
LPNEPRVSAFWGADGSAGRGARPNKARSSSRVSALATVRESHALTARYAALCPFRVGWSRLLTDRPALSVRQLLNAAPRRLASSQAVRCSASVTFSHPPRSQQKLRCLLSRLSDGVSVGSVAHFLMFRSRGLASDLRLRLCVASPRARLVQGRSLPRPQEKARGLVQLRAAARCRRQPVNAPLIRAGCSAPRSRRGAWLHRHVGLDRSGRICGDDWCGHDWRDTARLF